MDPITDLTSLQETKWSKQIVWTIPRGQSWVSWAPRVHIMGNICMVGNTRIFWAHLGFVGSDMDGGFSAARLPEGIDRPAHLERIAEALRNRGWNDDDLVAFRAGNWRRIFEF